jgi:hypothetical protein
LICEYYENTGQNEVGFENLVQIFSNTLSANTTQTVCLGTAGSSISGDTYGALPAGITVSGTGYQWAYGSSSSGPWTDISGATSATYTPTSAAAPFNSAGTYYIIRKAILSSANNYAPNPYIATNESNAAEFIVNPRPTATITSSNTAICTGSSTNITGNVTATGAWTLTLSNSSTATGTGNGNFSISVSPGSTTTYTIASLVDANCSSNAGDLTGSTEVTVNPLPQGSLAGSTICSGDNGQFTFTSSSGTGPFTLIINSQSYSGVVSGTPFNANPNPSSTTAYTLTSITDANSCVRTSGITGGGTATITVNPLPQGSLAGNTVCSGGTGQFTFTSSSGTGPFTLIINSQSYSGVMSGTPFNANPNPSGTTAYTLTSITDASSCVRTSGITGSSATITITTIGVTVDSIFSPKCPQLTIGFEPDNSNYNSGYSEVRFSVERTGNSTANWDFDFNITGATEITLNSTPAYTTWDGTNGTYTALSSASIEITVRFKNIENTFIDVVFEVTEISDINGCNNTTSQSDNSSVLPMPALGPFN